MDEGDQRHRLAVRRWMNPGGVMHSMVTVVNIL